MDERRAPTDLTIVALINLMCGLGGVRGMLFHLGQRHLNVDLNIVGIPIFIGLIYFSRGWRVCALMMSGLYFILGPIFIYLASKLTEPTVVTLFGFSFTNVTKFKIYTFGAVLMGYALWQYRVLMRPSIRALFYPDESA